MIKEIDSQNFFDDNAKVYGERYLKQSIVSIKNQSYKNWELIFFDNDSSDKSKKIFQKFKDKRLKYFFSNKVLKLYEARNLAISKAKGYYINNLDINIITQTPKIKKYKKKMIENIAKLCEISKNQINIKGKTTEKLGIIGKEKAIACEVITSVIKYD